MMRLHTIVAATALCLLCARTTNAAEKLKVGMLADLVTGVTIPIGDSDYKNFADASFKIGLRVGAVLHINEKFAVAPEAEFDIVALEPDKNDFPSSSGTVNVSTSITEERGLFGARFIIPFSLGAFFVRAMIGVDHIGGTTTAQVGGFTTNTSFGSTGFAMEPGFGVEFNIIKHLVVGATTGFPIAFHDFGNGSGNNRKFTAGDVDFMAFVGFRL